MPTIYVILTGALLVTLFLIVVLYLFPQFYRYGQLQKWRKLEGVMALTYDDGPDEETSPQLLDLLAEYGVKATFYLVGFRAEKSPNLVARHFSDGHEIGTHSHSHLHAWKIWPWRDARDALSAYETIGSQISNKAPYRPPFGKISLPTLLQMWMKKRRVEWWSRPTNDTDDSFQDPKLVARQIVAEKQPVILMHSHHAEPHRRTYMLSLTRELIEECAKQNIDLVTMSELNSMKASNV